MTLTLILHYDTEGPLNSVYENGSSMSILYENEKQPTKRNKTQTFEIRHRTNLKDSLVKAETPIGPLTMIFLIPIGLMSDGSFISYLLFRRFRV
jgi:hypothetical protein